MKKLIKRFDFGFNSQAREEMDLTGGLRLGQRGIECPRVTAAKSHRPSLIRYSTSTDLTARTWIETPTGLKQWLGFSATVRKLKPLVNPYSPSPLYGLRFRLTDGVSDYYWDGAAWSTPTLDAHWNTEGQVASAIASFPVTTQGIGFIVNMWTTDARLTPQLLGLRLVYDADVNEARDLLYGSLVPELEALRCRGRVAIRMAADGNTIDMSDLAALGFTSSYKLADVVAVYDHTNDASHLANLLDSFAGGIASLSSSILAGDVAWVDFEFTPTAAVQTSADYSEVSVLPRVDVVDVRETNRAESTTIEDYVINVDTGEGWKLPAPRVADVGYRLEILADKQFDAFSIREALMKWAAENKFITMRSTGERYDISVTIPPSFMSESQLTNLVTIEATVTVSNVAFFEDPATPAYGIQTANFGGFGNVELTISKA